MMIGIIRLLALTWDFAMRPMTRPIMQEIRDAVVISHVNGRIWKDDRSAPDTKTMMKLVMTVMMNGGTILPMKN